MKILKKEARILREKISTEVKLQANEQGFSLSEWEGKKLSLSVEVHENWFTKKGDIKRKDISNREKFLVDSIFQGLYLEDKCIWKHTAKKVQQPDEKKIKVVVEVKRI